MRFATLLFLASVSFTMGSLLYIQLLSNDAVLLIVRVTGNMALRIMETGALVIAFGVPLLLGVVAVLEAATPRPAPDHERTIA